MKSKLALIAITCSVAVSILFPATQPVPPETTPPVIMTTNGHGMGS